MIHFFCCYLCGCVVERVKGYCCSPLALQARKRCYNCSDTRRGKSRYGYIYFMFNILITLIQPSARAKKQQPLTLDNSQHVILRRRAAGWIFCTLLSAETCFIILSLS